MSTVSPWPKLGWEEQVWVPTIPPDLVSRSIRRRHEGPYQTAITPDIAGLDISLSSKTVALADEASIEIARFDAECGSQLAPFATVLLRSESASSSQIENLTSGAKAIAMADIGEPAKRNAELIVANVHAMQAAVSLAENLDEDAILQMHQVLMTTHDESIAGQWRHQQVWIGGTGFGPHEASFVAPHHERVPEAMRDLLAFIARDDIPILTHAALAHAQFETIHPFADGNGRTGRALLHAMLRAKGLTRDVTVPVSAGLLTDTAHYFDALTAYRNGDASIIVSLVAEASITALINGRQLLRELQQLRSEWQAVITARRDSAAWRLVDLLPRQPILNVEIAARELGTTTVNARIAIEHLEKAGVLAEFSGRDRKRLWQARTVLDALDDFAARAGRRVLS